MQRRGRRIPDFAHETKTCVCRRLLTSLAEEAEEKERCLCAGGVRWHIQVKSESILKVGNEADGESREITSEVPAPVKEEPDPGPGGDVDGGGRTSIDMLSELGSALVELMGRLCSQNVSVENGVKDERVSGFGLAAAEVGG